MTSTWISAVTFSCILSICLCTELSTTQCNSNTLDYIEPLRCSICDTQRISGIVADCGCTIETVQQANDAHFKPMLDELTVLYVIYCMRGHRRDLHLPPPPSPITAPSFDTSKLIYGVAAHSGLKMVNVLSKLVLSVNVH